MSSQPPLKKAVFFWRRFPDIIILMNDRIRILAIHGAGMNAGIFASLVPHLREYRLEAINLPGHKDAVSPLHDIAAMAQYVRDIMTKDEPASNILMGHSMGALVAMEAAADPSVAGLVLLGAAARMPVNADLLKTAQEDPQKAQMLVAKWSVFKEHPQAEAVGKVVSAIMRDTNPVALYQDFKACDDYRGPQQIKLPALVIAGEADKMVPSEKSRELAEHLGGLYACVPHCGHMMMQEKPLEIAAETAKFIRGLKR